ncbi:hypothetical protein M8818_005116 [Zalaria obscura]|uniref:Uncharacterized protein n=1 Tax=Zalaria obscura TaxID=2024903 RepID=A0ACC3S9S7_9PEZI
MVRVGTPPQDFRSFPSTAGQETLVPILGGCTADEPSNCGQLRGIMPFHGKQGSGFNTNESSSWQGIGFYTTNLEDQLGIFVRASYGHDTVGLQVENSGGLTQSSQIIGGIEGLLPWSLRTLPYIWLPQDSCDAFAAAFGLQYDNTTELYTVNNTIHETLVSQNPQLTFVLGTDPYSGATLALVLPYAAFDLQASYPIYPNATRYFPIRQAANEAQYTIGRTFLQEAYITVDYGRSNFTVCQATFSDPMPDEQLVAILPPGYNTSTSNSTAPHHSSSSIGSGAIAGIVVGAVVALTLLVAGFLYLRRRRNRSHPGPSENPDVDVAIHVDEEKAIVGEELDSSDVNELPPGMPPEVEGDAALWSTHGANAKAELDSGQRTWAEAEGSPGFVHELEGSDPLARRAAER